MVPKSVLIMSGIWKHTTDLVIFDREREVYAGSLILKGLKLTFVGPTICMTLRRVRL